MKRKGIILAGGTGKRLWPITLGISKQLLPVYDKPMIYYPLSVLMLSGIQDIAVITTPDDREAFERLLGDGSQWGLSFTYIMQAAPNGIAEAYLLAKDFLDGAPSALVLGDNIFFGHGLESVLRSACDDREGATIFGYHVSDPERYGVIAFAPNGDVSSLVEKPKKASSSFALTGLYFLDGQAPELAAQIEPSNRNELEIVDLLELYRAKGCLNAKRMGRGFAWLDTGTPSSLLEASNFVRTLTDRQGLQIAALEEIAYRLGWIDADQLKQRSQLFSQNAYGDYLQRILAE
jgi:glucose-1-phosphate thymidylyltransferase